MDREENCIWKQVHANNAILNGEAELVSELDLARRARDFFYFFVRKSRWKDRRNKSTVVTPTYSVSLAISRSQHSGHVWRYLHYLATRTLRSLTQEEI